jgi:hypothetical protein
VSATRYLKLFYKYEERTFKMALLFDMSQITLSGLFASVKPGHGIEINLIRHMVLNSLRFNKQKFEDKYGKIIICIDNRHYWRKDVFPYYKYKRKEDREKSGFDWDTIWQCMSTIRHELEDFMPYQVLEVDGAEADDIIAVLAKNLSKKEKVLIISGDKDLVQLTKYPNVAQWAPLDKEWRKTDDPEKFLKFHIMKGDSGDSIPNFLMPDQTFVQKLRQKPLREEKLELWSTLDPTMFCTSEMLRNWKRNELLISLDHIPGEMQSKILEEYKKPFDSSNNRMFDYFTKKRLNVLIKDIGQFRVSQEKTLLERV